MKKIFFGLLILVAIMVIIAFLPQNKEKECFNLIRAKNYSKALRVGLKAIKNDPKNGKLYMCVGESYYYLNNYNEAIKYLKLAENYITSQNTLNILHNFEALTYYKLGNLYEKMGELDEALEFYKKSLPFSSEKDKSAIYNMMSTIYYKKENYKKAIEYDKKDIIVNQQLGNYDDLAVDYLNLGADYISIQKFSEAQQYLEKGLSMEKKIGNPDLLGVGYNYLGDMYHEEGDNTSAKKYLKKALHYYKLAGDKAGIKNVTEALNKINLHSFLGKVLEYGTTLLLPWIP